MTINWWAVPNVQLVAKLSICSRNDPSLVGRNVERQLMLVVKFYAIETKKLIQQED
ncbi:MAG: hypothetical protein DHS20C16_20840 [Phycisphaerae bacterium]|nr:MAG: hypothetical protein DHS20C16_20840 [Phycisphaerae bacterium]